MVILSISNQYFHLHVIHIHKPASISEDFAVAVPVGREEVLFAISISMNERTNDSLQVPIWQSFRSNARKQVGLGCRHCLGLVHLSNIYAGVA